MENCFLTIFVLFSRFREAAGEFFDFYFFDFSWGQLKRLGVENPPSPVAGYAYCSF